jgi:malate synthase
MEDAATAEISRTQLWQWIHHGALLDDGRALGPELFRAVLAEELLGIEQLLGTERIDAGSPGRAAELFAELILSDDLADFLTLPAYRLLVGAQPAEAVLPTRENEQPVPPAN